MKKEKSPILVILTIFFLSLFIILPPTFRKLVPKEEKKKTISKLTVVICNKMYTSELYRVNSKTKYDSDGTIVNTITYTVIDASQIQQNTEQSIENYEQVQENNDTTDSIAAELNYFKSIPNLDIVDSVGSTVVTINQREIDSHPTESKLISYLSDNPKSQKSFYEELGYTCNIIES